LKKFMTYDGRRTPSDGKSSLGLWPGELKKCMLIKIKSFSAMVACAVMSLNTRNICIHLPTLFPYLGVLIQFRMGTTQSPFLPTLVHIYIDVSEKNFYHRGCLICYKVTVTK